MLLDFQAKRQILEANDLTELLSPRNQPSNVPG